MLCQQDLHHRLSLRYDKKKFQKLKGIAFRAEELITFCLFFARFRIFKKASQFCGHTCRLELRPWHDTPAPRMG